MSVSQLQMVASGRTQDGLLAKIRSAGRARIYRSGSHLFEQADGCNGVYWIESGLVGLRKLNEDGTTMLVNLARAGDFVGYSPLLTDSEHLASAEVLKESRIVFIDLSTMHRLISEIPGLLGSLLRQATRDLSALEDKYLQMATRQAHVRLAALLLSFNDNEDFKHSQSGCSFPLPIMNKDIADLIGIRPETLSRAIGQLRTAGLAELRDHIVHIPCIAKLAQLSGYTPEPAYAPMAA